MIMSYITGEFVWAMISFRKFQLNTLVGDAGQDTGNSEIETGHDRGRSSI